MSKKYISIIIGGVIVLALIALALGLGGGGKEQVTGPPFNITPPSGEAEIKDCRENLAMSVRMVRKGLIVKEMSVEDFLHQEGSFEVTELTGRKQPAYRVADLVPEGAGVESIKLLPCTGRPMVFRAKDLPLIADVHLLMSNRKNELKLVRKLEGKIIPFPLIKSIYAIQLLP